MDSFKDLIDAIDAANQKEKPKKLEVACIRMELEDIFQVHNESKLPEIGLLLKKFSGKEEKLLLLVREKYLPKKKECSQNDATRRWLFVLKNFQVSNKADKKCQKQHNWHVDESLNSIRNVLDELALSIRGVCKNDVGRAGERRLVVQQKGFHTEYCDMDQIKVKVEKMRDLVHTCYRGKSLAPNIVNEHDRRKAEKDHQQGKTSQVRRYRNKRK